MARTKKTAETVVETVKEAAVAAPAAEEVKAEVKAPAKKAAAKKAPAAKKTAEPKAETKTAAKKPAAKKAPAKKAAAAVENLYIQLSGNEVTSAALIEKAKADAGVKAPKSVDVYVRPEINMVYYVIDGETFGNFELF